MTARWRNEPSETGLRAIGQRPRGLQLRENGSVLITVSPYGGGWRGPVAGWYWVAYGFDINTCNELASTKEEAKAQADAWFKANRKKP